MPEHDGELFAVNTQLIEKRFQDCVVALRREFLERPVLGFERRKVIGKCVRCDQSALTLWERNLLFNKLEDYFARNQDGDGSDTKVPRNPMDPKDYRSVTLPLPSKKNQE